MILRLDEGSPEEIGGKTAGLARLLELGLPVPPGLVVPVSAKGVLDDPTRVLDELGEPLAVRSSAVGEDAADRSAAGQYESLMGVRGADLSTAVRQVFESATTERAIAYRGQAPVGMAVIIQRQVPADRAGVAFSIDPLGTDDDSVLVEAVFGHGEALVSGRSNPDRFWIAPNGAVRARLAVKEGPFRLLRSLRDDEVRRVAELTRRAAGGFGHPVDVEFCFERGELWLVQCRAITAR